VALVDGTAPTLEEMARRAETGELFWGYSVGPYGRVMVVLLEAPRFVGRDALIEVVLDSGASVFCTLDHRVLTRDGRMVEAETLRPGDSLMPLYRCLARGYETVYQPLNGHLLPTHRLADEWNLRHGIYADQPGTHRHHLDYDRRNNNPWNLTRMEASAHIQLHNQDNFGESFDPDEHSEAIREAFARLRQSSEWREHLSRVQQERALAFWHDDAYALTRARELARRQHPSAATLQAYREAQLRIPGPAGTGPTRATDASGVAARRGSPATTG
jgi:dCTP deaminase